MAKLCTERDKRQDLIESKRMYAEGGENNNDLQKFLAGGIDIKTVFFCISFRLYIHIYLKTCFQFWVSADQRAHSKGWSVG